MYICIYVRPHVCRYVIFYTICMCTYTCLPYLDIFGLSIRKSCSSYTVSLYGKVMQGEVQQAQSYDISRPPRGVEVQPLAAVKAIFGEWERRYQSMLGFTIND